MEQEKGYWSYYGRTQKTIQPMKNLTPLQFILGCLLASAIIFGLAVIKLKEENKKMEYLIHGGEILKP